MGLFDIFKKKANKTYKDNLQKEAEEAGYQAYMDYAKGSLTPDEAYASRGFVKDKDGKWVYAKLVTFNNADKTKSNNANEKSVIDEKEDTEITIIKQEIYEITSKCNTANPNEKIDISNIIIGKCVNKPGCIGCFREENGWYLYRVDDRFNLLKNGPFSINGIIVALLHSLYIPSELQNRKFSNEEYRLYLTGEKPV